MNIETLKSWLENCPPPGYITPDYIGSVVRLDDGEHYICAECIARLNGRGCDTGEDVRIVFDGEPIPGPCALCEEGQSDSDTLEEGRSTMEEMFGPVISSYSRADALEDGQLVDVADTAKEAGFKIPVALTRNCWEQCVAVPDSLEGTGQSIGGRLWDVLFMAHTAASRNSGSSTLRYKISALTGMIDGAPKREEKTLTMKIGPGDEGEPAITIGFPMDF